MEKLIRVVTFKPDTEKSTVTEFANNLGKKCMGVHQFKDRWEVTIAFDNGLDYLAFQMAAGLITMEAT